MSDVVKCMSCGQANHVPAVSPGKSVLCGRCKSPLMTPDGGHPVAVTDGGFQQLVGSGKPVVVDFWAAWCGPCRTIAPVIESLASEMPGITFAKLNVDENPATSATFRVSGIPTLIFFRDGQERGRLVGAAGAPQIRQAIAQHLKSEG